MVCKQQNASRRVGSRHKTTNFRHVCIKLLKVYMVNAGCLTPVVASDLLYNFFLLRKPVNLMTVNQMNITTAEFI